MITNNDAERQFLEAREAVRDKTNPQAFLRLGILYARGIGTTANHVLANYFYDKAYALGCEEVETYIEQEYESGTKNILKDFERRVDSQGNVDPDAIIRFRKIIEKARLKKNFGLLSRLCKYLPLLYPEYNKERAMDDILNDRDSVDADIFYATCTANMQSEVRVDLQDCLLQQLYAPITQDDSLLQLIQKDDDTDLLSTAESELMQCLVNYSSAYHDFCKKRKVRPQEIAPMESVIAFPYLNVSALVALRKQALKCLLSLKNVFPIIPERFLENMMDDVELVTISEEARGDLQMFLISFVELNLDIDTIQKAHLSLIQSYRENDLAALAAHLNDYLKRLTDKDIKHHLPPFSPQNLPKIELR